MMKSNTGLSCRTALYFSAYFWFFWKFHPFTSQPSIHDTFLANQHRDYLLTQTISM